MASGSQDKALAASAGGAGDDLPPTDLQGLEAGDAVLPCGAPAYYAMPEGGRDLPIVLVAQEIFGLNDHIRDIVRRFGKLGYLAVAPDFLIRYGDPSKAPDIETILREIVARVPDSETMMIFDESLDFAESRGGARGRAAITGFCWGGRVAWLYAAHNPELLACVPWYGRLDGAHTAVQPQWPIDVAEKISVSTLGLYGGADPSIPLDLVDRMMARLAQAGAPADILVYDEAPHAFFADYRPSYRPQAAKDAWSRMLAFLRTHGVG
ncbi:MAG: dienelactone hydrolase family protein [Methylocystis sp.]|uniref:dienelactone hydrolase family protein n=1 Tax=Methylocystis sp. TaxID=1911079 RepID=UPI003DA59A8C